MKTREQIYGELLRLQSMTGGDVSITRMTELDSAIQALKWVMTDDPKIEPVSTKHT